MKPLLLHPGLKGSDMKAVVLGGVHIHVKFRHGVDLYFDLPMLESMNGWQKIWFFLRNDVAAPLLVFTGNCHIPNPTGGTGWPRRTSASYNPCARSFNSYNRRG
jgi:hypothetical protein